MYSRLHPTRGTAQHWGARGHMGVALRSHLTLQTTVDESGVLHEVDRVEQRLRMIEISCAGANGLGTITNLEKWRRF